MDAAPAESRPKDNECQSGNILVYEKKTLTASGLIQEQQKIRLRSEFHSDRDPLPSLNSKTGTGYTNNSILQIIQLK